MTLIQPKTIGLQYAGGVFLALLLVLFLFPISACKKSPQHTGSSSVRVGLYASLTGPEGSFGTDSLRGVQLAMQEINRHGGVLGYPIQLIVKDNQSKAGESSLIARELISRDHVVALLGEVASGRSLEAAPIAQKSGIPMIASGATNFRVTQIGNDIFRVCFIDELQGQVAAKFLRSLGIQKAAIMADTSTDYSIGLAKAFAQDFTKLGGQIVARQNFTEGDKDFNAQLTALKAANPQAVFLPTYYTYAPLIISQARQIGLNVPFMGSDGWDSAEFLKIGGKSVENTYFSSHFTSENQTPAVQNFVKSYYQKYHVLPSALAALAYDSMKLLADAIVRAGSVDPAKIRVALENTKNFPGITGAITFDENRNPRKPVVIIRVHNGKFTYFETVSL